MAPPAPGSSPAAAASARTRSVVYRSVALASTTFVTRCDPDVLAPRPGEEPVRGEDFLDRPVEPDAAFGQDDDVVADALDVGDDVRRREPHGRSRSRRPPPSATGGNPCQASGSSAATGSSRSQHVLVVFLRAPASARPALAWPPTGPPTFCLERDVECREPRPRQLVVPARDPILPTERQQLSQPEAAVEGMVPAYEADERQHAPGLASRRAAEHEDPRRVVGSPRPMARCRSVVLPAPFGRNERPRRRSRPGSRASSRAAPISSRTASPAIPSPRRARGSCGPFGERSPDQRPHRARRCLPRRGPPCEPGRASAPPRGQSAWTSSGGGGVSVCETNVPCPRRAWTRPS